MTIMQRRSIALCACLVFLTACSVAVKATPNSIIQDNPTERPNTVAPTPAVTVTPTSAPVDMVLSDRLTVHKSGYAISYLVSDEEFESFGDLMNSEAAVEAVEEAYRFFEDDFDFVFVINNTEKDFSKPGNGITFALRTYPESGLGLLTTFPDGLPYVKLDTPLEEETSRLMTMIHFAHKEAIRKGPALHEMMHRWGNFVLPGPREYAMHWGFSDVGGQLGGFTDLELLEDGTFHGFNRYRQDACFSPNTPSAEWDTRNSIPYAPLELYLMGLIGIEEVPPQITVLENAWFVDDANCVVAGTKKVYETAEILQSARVPGVEDAQKHFKILTLVVTPAPLTEEEWDAVVQQLLWFEMQADDNDSSVYNFYEATGGRGSVELGGLAGSLRQE